MTPEQMRHAILQQLTSLQRAGVGQLPRVTIPPSAYLEPADEPPRPVPATPSGTRGQSAPSPPTSPPATPKDETASRATAPSTRPPAPTLASESRKSPAMPRPASPPPVPPPLFVPVGESPPSRPLSVEERRVALHVIQSEVKSCTRCPQLVANRTQTVFGVGTPTPRLCFFGEAPGADEDRTGEPFVGRAGQLLNKIIEAMTLKREEVYILNVLKCRPPDNRAPQDDEIEHCRGYFERQLEILRPEFICCLGASAAKTMLHSAFSLGKMRGRFYNAHGAKVIVTYHPAYLLRNPAAKKDTWEDIQMLMREMEIPIPKGNST